MNRKPQSGLVASLVLWSAMLSCLPVQAQFRLPELDNLAVRQGGAPALKVSARFTKPNEQGRSILTITVDIERGFHIYSLTQPSGGPQKTKIKLDTSDQYRLLGQFSPSRTPRSHIDEKVWVGLAMEEHYGKISWSAPLQMAPGVVAKILTILGVVDAQACNADSCIPIQVAFAAKLAVAKSNQKDSAEAGSVPMLQGPIWKGSYRPINSSVTIEGYLRPAKVDPGARLTLVLTAIPDPGWHVYVREDRDPKAIGKGKPTLIVIDHPVGIKVYQTVSRGSAVEEKPAALPKSGMERYHADTVSWEVPFDVPASWTAGNHLIAGMIGYQACTDVSCKPPQAARFQVHVQAGGRAPIAKTPVVFAAARYGTVAKLANQLPLPVDLSDKTRVNPPDSGIQERRLAVHFFFGFLGGLVLNLMPCVLPVIGLKLMSFLEQAGQSRAQALSLNLWYSLGVILVFLLVATMAVGFEMPVGSQFADDTFNITLTAVVFAMGLSLVGVWELPIPGFAGSAKASQWAAREGPLGAFLKGVLTTILATPCIGPFLGPAFGWAVQQTSLTAYTIFCAAGLGMASPYLLIGFFPELIRFLPKPGPWMATFKQVMGFVLMGTVIFLLTFIHPIFIVPTVTLLTGIAAGCWWIGRRPITAPLAMWWRDWAVAVAFCTFVGLFSFGWLLGVMEHRFHKYASLSGGQLLQVEGSLPWQPFTRERLERLTSEGRTVMVDFTADWCMICKDMERRILNTPEIIRIVEQNEIVPLRADYTKKPPEIAAMLKKLQSTGIPVLAIYSPLHPDQPQVFRGPYTRKMLIKALEKAGASPAETIADLTLSGGH